MNGNGAFEAIFAGASSDGSKVFFTTDEPLVIGDTDSSGDVYERSGGITTEVVSQGLVNGNGAFEAIFAGASSDGSKVFFTTDEHLVIGDSDGSGDVYERSGGITTQVSQGQVNGNGDWTADFVGASSDGSKVFFVTDEQLVSGDTNGAQDVYERSAGTTTLVSVDTSPPNTTITGGPSRWDQRSNPDLHLLLIGSWPELPVQARRRRLCRLQLAEDHGVSHRRLPYLLRPRQGLVRQRRPDAGLALVHGGDRRGQRLGLDPGGHGGDGGQGQPRDHQALRLDPAGDRPPQRRLHGLRRPHGRGLHPKRRLHRQLLGLGDHPDPGHLRRSDRQGDQLDRGQELARRRGGERRLDRRLCQRHPDRVDGRRRDSRG